MARTKQTLPRQKRASTDSKGGLQKKLKSNDALSDSEDTFSPTQEYVSYSPTMPPPTEAEDKQESPKTTEAEDKQESPKHTEAKDKQESPKPTEAKDKQESPKPTEAEYHYDPCNIPYKKEPKPTKDSFKPTKDSFKPTKAETKPTEAEAKDSFKSTEAETKVSRREYYYDHCNMKYVPHESV
jgi:hypothetical protein